MQQHTLIIGGTGMLTSASLELAGHCHTLTLVARTKRSLSHLEKSLPRSISKYHLLQLDWSDPAGFLNSLSNHAQRVGDPELIVAWFHCDSLGPDAAVALSTQGKQCLFFQVRGSAAAKPTSNAGTFLSAYNIPGNVDYHQVILGFHNGANGSRWLHDSEISNGILAAINNPRPISIVGSVNPWSQRP